MAREASALLVSARVVNTHYPMGLVGDEAHSPGGWRREIMGVGGHGEWGGVRDVQGGGELKGERSERWSQS